MEIPVVSGPPKDSKLSCQTPFRFYKLDQFHQRSYLNLWQFLLLPAALPRMKAAVGPSFPKIRLSLSGL